MKSKTLLIRIGAVVLLIAIAACMMVIGRGHTVYFDNVTLEHEGVTYNAMHKVEVTVKGERVAKLMKRERGVATWIGDNLHVELAVTWEKGDEPQLLSVNVRLPHNVDGIIINLPALLAGQPQEVWFSEFIPQVVEETEPTETTDGLGLGGEFAGLE